VGSRNGRCGPTGDPGLPASPLPSRTAPLEQLGQERCSGAQIAVVQPRGLVEPPGAARWPARAMAGRPAWPGPSLPQLCPSRRTSKPAGPSRRLEADLSCWSHRQQRRSQLRQSRKGFLAQASWQSPADANEATDTGQTAGAAGETARQQRGLRVVCLSCPYGNTPWRKWGYARLGCRGGLTPVSRHPGSTLTALSRQSHVSGSGYMHHCITRAVGAGRNGRLENDSRCLRHDGRSCRDRRRRAWTPP